jgi:hypothetical protein
VIRSKHRKEIGEIETKGMLRVLLIIFAHIARRIPRLVVVVVVVNAGKREKKKKKKKKDSSILFNALDLYLDTSTRKTSRE